MGFLEHTESSVRSDQLDDRRHAFSAIKGPQRDPHFGHCARGSSEVEVRV